MRFHISGLLCTAALAGVTALFSGCATRQVLVLGDRGCIPAPVSSPDAAPAAKPAPEVKGFEEPQQPALPTDMDATSQPAIVPDGGKTVAPAKTKRTYKVVKGDTLSAIAWSYSISWKELAKENGLNEKSSLKVGQILTLPEKAAANPRKRQAVSSKKKAATSAKKKAAKTARGSKALPADGIHVVQPNDSLWKIAHIYGLKSSDIQEANPGKDFGKLQVGDKIVLPKGGNAAPVATEKPAVTTETTPVTPADTTVPVVPTDTTTPEATVTEPTVPTVPTEGTTAPVTPAEPAVVPAATPAETPAATGTEGTPAVPAALE